MIQVNWSPIPTLIPRTGLRSRERTHIVDGDACEDRFLDGRQPLGRANATLLFSREHYLATAEAAADAGAKSFVNSSHELMAVIGSRSAALEQRQWRSR
jgi:hypothetical protein